MKWHDIWEKKGNQTDPSTSDLSLMQANGYDTGAGSVVDTWQTVLAQRIEQVRTALSLTQDDILLDAGCGGGLLSRALQPCVKQVCGIDYSSTLINLARAAAPLCSFTQGSLTDLAYRNGTFTKIVSYSVFHYLSDMHDAEHVLDHFLRCTTDDGVIAIFDIPDKAMQHECEQVRAHALGAKTYKEKYAQLSHLYYEKEWFRAYARQNRLSCGITQNTSDTYINGRFRFNVVLSRKGL